MKAYEHGDVAESIMVNLQGSNVLSYMVNGILITYYGL
jgi:hypothetical protein